MKVRFDEHMSKKVTAALRAFLAERPGFQVDHVRDHHPKKTDDPTWLKQFAAEGGHGVVSGDTQILQNWPNLIAYMESGLIAVFPPSRFDALKGFGQASLIIRWWPCIIEKMKISSSGDCWRIPWSWTPDVTKFEKLKDPRFSSNDKKAQHGITSVPTLHQFRPRARL